MLSDLITNMLKENAKDIALIGGMVLLIRIVIWKTKQLAAVVFPDHPDNAASSRRNGRGSNHRPHKASAAAKPVKNADYYAGRAAALKGANATTASARYKHKLSRKYGKASLSYAAGYREGVKQKEWNEYVRLVRQEEEQERMEALYAELEQKHAELAVLRQKLETRTYRNAKNEAARRDIVGY